MIASPIRFALFSVLFLFTTGCALTKDYVSLQYVPDPSPTRVEGAEKAQVMVSTVDSRTVKDRVSSKKNGYGMEMAPIIATNDIPTLFQQALETELEHMGFKKGPGANLICDVTKFYNDFKIGFWAGDAAADVMINLQVKDSQGQLLYAKSFSAEGRKENIQLAGGNNAKAALEAGLAEVVRKAVRDPELSAALMKAGGNATVSLR